MSATALDIAAVVTLVQETLAASANPEKARGMQAYMKTEMPFYGVQKAGRTPIIRRIRKEFRPYDRDEYEALVMALWNLPHREEKYLAQGVAMSFREFIDPDSLPIYERFIVDGAWWDFVDETATQLIRELVLDFPEDVWPIVERWNEEHDMWLRRASIICQIGAKERTDRDRLFAFCAARMHEVEFFIRKAIGWALRDYARTDPDAVARFVLEHREMLSGLSFREATKHIGDRLRS